MATGISACSLVRVKGARCGGGGRARNCSKNCQGKKKQRKGAWGTRRSRGAKCCRGYVVRAQISKASGISKIPKGAGWKTSMVPCVSMMLMESRVSMTSEGMPDEVSGNAGGFGRE